MAAGCVEVRAGLVDRSRTVQTPCLEDLRTFSVPGVQQLLQGVPTLPPVRGPHFGPRTLQEDLQVSAPSVGAIRRDVRTQTGVAEGRNRVGAEWHRPVFDQQHRLFRKETNPLFSVLQIQRTLLLGLLSLL